MALGYKDIGIRKSEFVAKTQFLWSLNNKQLNYYAQKENLKEEKIL